MVPAQVKTLTDFISWCRANPRQATYGTVGAGSLHHFIGVALSRAEGLNFVHVPYQALAAVQDLLAGRIAERISAGSFASLHPVWRVAGALDHGDTAKRVAS